VSTENEGAAVPGVEPPSAPETPGAALASASASGARTADSARRAEPEQPTAPTPPAPSAASAGEPTGEPAGGATAQGAGEYALPTPEERTAQLPTVGASDGGSAARTGARTGERAAAAPEAPGAGWAAEQGSEQPTQHREPWASARHGRPGPEPTEPGRPGQSGQSEQPAQPFQAAPHGRPGEPTPLGHSEHLEEPTLMGQSGQLGEPTEPTQPGRPGQPAHPAHPAHPGDPTPRQPHASPQPPAAHSGWPGAQSPIPPGGGGANPAGGAGWPPPPPPGGAWGSGPVPPPPGGSPRKRTGAVVAAVLAAALVAGGVGGGIGYLAADRNDSTSSTTVSSSGDPEVLNRSPKSVSGIAQRALPSVVTLEAQGAQGEGGTGTGFVYDKQGHILTNNHVVASAADGGKLTATFSDGKKYDAEVIGRAQGYDVAVLRLKNASNANLKPLPLGDSDKNVAVGDVTIAIGAPFGLAGTVTTGIVSAKNRPVASSGGGSSNASYMSALQTDASINPGNSGGPLLNAEGAVIGINSAIQSAGNGFGGEAQQSGSIGLGFAIPINQAKRVAETLIKTGQPVYPVIGVQVDMREQGDGARISEGANDSSEAVTPGGPADKAGLQPGDVITKLNNTVIDSGPTLISTIWTHKPGDEVTITYERDGKSSTVEVTLGSRKGDS
jgi:putative serine protease PepD